MLRTYRYEGIARELRLQIERGEFDGGRRLPSERELMGRYGVQRNTIRQAIALLEAEGWVVTEPKRGTFAARRGAEAPAAHAAPAGPTARTGTVLVINAWNRASTALDAMLVGLSDSLQGSGLSLARFDSRPKDGQALHDAPTPEYLAAHQVAGAVLWPQNPADHDALRRLRSAVPLVLADRRVAGFEADCVRFDDVAGGRMVTEHLIARGHRRIGFLADEAFAETVQHRWRGYAMALEAAGIPPDSRWLALYSGIQDPPFTGQMRLFLSGAGSGGPLTAVVCSNDSTALTLLRFLRAEGLRVPGDIAVTGYGDLLPDYLDALELTTVSQPFGELGRAVGALLRERIGGEGPVGGYRQAELPVRLIVRASSGPPDAAPDDRQGGDGKNRRNVG